MTASGGTSSIGTVIVDANHVPIISPVPLVAQVGRAHVRDKKQGSATTDNAAGATVLDTATVTGSLAGITPTGTVTYSFTGTSGTSLAGLTAPEGWTVSGDKLTWSETVTMSNGNVPDSGLATELPPGSYMFAGQYSGDAHFGGSTSAPEPMTVDGRTGAIIEPPRTPCKQVTFDLCAWIGRPIEGHGPRPGVRRHDWTANHAIVPHLLRAPFAPSSSFQVDVNQSPPSPLPPLAALNGHVTLHNGDARLMALPTRSVTITPADVKIDVSNLTPGDYYYFGIRYSTKSLVGEPWPFGTNATVDDVFGTTISTGGLVPKSTVNLPILSSGDSAANLLVRRRPD